MSSSTGPSREDARTRAFAHRRANLVAGRIVILALVSAAACVDLTRPRTPVTTDAAIRDVVSTDVPPRHPAVDAPVETAFDAPMGQESGTPPDVMAPIDGEIDVATPRTTGSPCALAADCLSGSCVDGRCCDTTCASPCRACNLPEKEGVCTLVPAGEDPRQDCAAEEASTCGRDGSCDGQGVCRKHVANTECSFPRCEQATETAAGTCDGNGLCRPGASRSCAPGVCAAGACSSQCTAQTDCQTGFFCMGSCVPRRAAGVACSVSHECSSGVCVDGVCCKTSCAQSCYACNLAGAVGTCSPIATGLDPGSECLAQAATTCGRAGGCNGAGACRLHAAGVTCSGISCSGSVETGPKACDGAGSCRPVIARACGAYLCNGDACGTSCTRAAQCRVGHHCAAGVCTPFGAPPVLHWKLDETSGTTAADASGTGLAGTYLGSVGMPTPSTLVPIFKTPNPASRSFSAGSRHAIRLAPAPASTKPTNDFTVSLWFRTTTLDVGHDPPASSEALSLGDNYFIRIRAADISWARRTTAGGYAVCFAIPSSNHLDGNWHHIAGVTTSAGMRTYFDGVEACANTLGEPNIYDKGTDLYVGRHAVGSADWDFDGNIDDVRIYTRPLPASEIAALAAGQ